MEKSAKETVSLSKIAWLVLLLLVVAILFVLVVTNRHTTFVNLVFWSVETRVFILLPTVFVLGFLGGYGLKTLLGSGSKRSSKRA